MVSAPLRLTNQLPVAGSLLVWEHPPEGGRDNLVGRQTVQVASGATVPIHTGEAQRSTAQRAGAKWSRLPGVHWLNVRFFSSSAMGLGNWAQGADTDYRVVSSQLALPMPRARLRTHFHHLQPTCGVR